MDIDVTATIEGLDALAARIDNATRQVTADAAHLLQASAMGHAPVGVFGNSTNTPGDLRRSIEVEGPEQIADHSWLARVGPTVIYGRQRELGGPIFPQAARVLRFEKFGEVVFTQSVFQFPRPYMKPAYEDQRPNIEAVVIATFSAAIEGR